MKKIFTLISGLLLLSAIPANADKVTLYLEDYDENQLASPCKTELTKENDGTYVIADFFDSGEPVTFTFEKKEAGQYAGLDITSAVKSGSRNYLMNPDGSNYLYCWLYGYNGVDDWSGFWYPYYYKDASYSFVYRYPAGDDYEYWANICIKGFVPDDPDDEESETTVTDWIYVSFWFNPVKSELDLANDAAYEKAIADLDAAQAKYEAALEEAVKANPDFNFDEWKSEITGAISNSKVYLAQALETATDDCTAFPAFSTEEINNMIAEMELAPLKAENQKAYEAVLAEIEKVEAEYNEAVEAIKEVEPDFDFADYKEIEDQIANAKKGAEQALYAANEDGEEYFFPFGAQDIEAWITEMKKAGFEKANTLAYDKVVAAIAEVEAKYTAAVAEIENEYPGIDLGEWKEIIGGQLAQVKSGAEQAFAAASDNGELFNFAFDGEEYEGMIAEMEKQAPNYAAYSKVLAEIEAVEENYNESVEAVKEVNPEFDFADWTEIEDQIAQAKKGAEQALYAANEDGEEFNYAFTGEDIENFITEMRKAGFADYNQAAYDQAVADITKVEAKYDAAIVEIEETYPDFDLTEWKSIIGGQLEEAKKGADQALAAASDNGELFNFPFTGEDIENAIADMEKDAAQSGIANIEAEVAAGKAKIFTLDGKAHFAPVKGQVNVIVRGNKSVKVMVK